MGTLRTHSDVYAANLEAHLLRHMRAFTENTAARSLPRRRV
jgi:hypothetical protein